MTAISIQSLKKEAKLARKNNNDLKNHSDSLKFIAKKYNFSSWEEMLDHCVLPFEKPVENIVKNDLKTFKYSHLEFIDPDDGSLFLLDDYYRQIETIRVVLKSIKNEIKKYQFYSGIDNYDILFYYVKEIMPHYTLLEHQQVQQMIRHYLFHREQSRDEYESNDTVKGIVALFDQSTGTEGYSDMREAHRVIYNITTNCVVDGVIQDTLILKWLLEHHNLLSLDHVHEFRNDVKKYMRFLKNNSNTTDIFDNELHQHTINNYLLSDLTNVTSVSGRFTKFETLMKRKQRLKQEQLKLNL